MSAQADVPAETIADADVDGSALPVKPAIKLDMRKSQSQNTSSDDERPSVIALSLNADYIDQAKQVLASLHYHARWKGEYILLCDDMNADQVEWFVQRGVHIAHVPHIFCNDHLPAVTFSRYAVFQPFVHRWKNIIVLDLDIIVRGGLDDLLDLDRLGAVRGYKSTIRENFVRDKSPALYDELDNLFDLNSPAFNGGVMAFPSHMIVAETFERACELSSRFLPISRFANQGLLNLLFYQQWTPLSPVYNAYVPTYLGRDGALLLPDARIIHFNGKTMKPWDSESLAFPGFSVEWQSNLALSSGILHLSHTRGETHILADSHNDKAAAG